MPARWRWSTGPTASRNDRTRAPAREPRSIGAHGHLAKDPQRHAQRQRKADHKHKPDIRIHGHIPRLMDIRVIPRPSRHARPNRDETLWNDAASAGETRTCHGQSVSQTSPSQHGITFIWQCAHCPWPCTQTSCSGCPQAGQRGITCGAPPEFGALAFRTLSFAVSVILGQAFPSASAAPPHCHREKCRTRHRAGNRHCRNCTRNSGGEVDGESAR